MDLDCPRTTLAERSSASSRLLGTPTQRAKQDIEERLAQAEQLIRTLRPAQALALLQAPGIQPAVRPVRWHPRWYLLVGWALIQRRQPQEARIALEQGLATLTCLLRRSNSARRTVLWEWQAWLHTFLGMSFLSDGQPVQALLCYQLGHKAIAEGIVHDAELAMRLYQGLGDAFLTLGASLPAIACLRLARQRGEDVCAPRARGLIEWSLGAAYQLQGDFPRAKRAFSQAISIFEHFNAQPQVAQLRSLLGQVLLGLQRADEAEAVLRQALGSAERTGDPSARALALQNLAALQLARGKPAKALRTIQDGLALLEEPKDGQISGQLYLTLACVSRSQQNLAATELALTAAIVAFKQARKYGLLVRAYECYGTFLAEQGRFPEAYEQLRLVSHHTVSALLKQARGLDVGPIGRAPREDEADEARGPQPCEHA